MKNRDAAKAELEAARQSKDRAAEQNARKQLGRVQELLDSSLIATQNLSNTPKSAIGVNETVAKMFNIQADTLSRLGTLDKTTGPEVIDVLAGATLNIPAAHPI